MAGKRLTWSTVARRELNEIVRFYRKRNGNNEYGRKLRQAFRQAQKCVEQNELIGQKVEGTDWRFIVVLNTYQMFYKIGEKHNVVSGVWDGRRNPEDLKLR